MKKLIFNRTITLSIVLACIWNFSPAKNIQEKSKEIKKSYNVSSKTILSVSNSFGTVHVDTWDKNEINVQVNIVTTASNEEKAQDLLDKINIRIDDSNPQSSISFGTSMASRMNTRKNESFEINYRINMPIRNALDLKNSFGDTYLENHSGDLDIKASYGNLMAGNLTGDSDIKLSFGSGISEIESIEKGDLKVSYSKMEIERIGVVDMNVQFSTVNVDKAGTVDLVAKYGEATFEEVGIMEANVNFSGFEIETLHGSLDLDVDYGNNTFIGGIDKKVSQLQIHNSFGPVTLELSNAMNATLTADMSYCDLKYPEGLIDFKKIIKDNSSKEYEGKIGSGADTSIEIVSKYGNVRIRE